MFARCSLTAAWIVCESSVVDPLICTITLAFVQDAAAAAAALQLASQPASTLADEIEKPPLHVGTCRSALQEPLQLPVQAPSAAPGPIEQDPLQEPLQEPEHDPLPDALQLPEQVPEQDPFDDRPSQVPTHVPLHEPVTDTSQVPEQVPVQLPWHWTLGCCTRAVHVPLHCPLQPPEMDPKQLADSSAPTAAWPEHCAAHWVSMSARGAQLGGCQLTCKQAEGFCPRVALI
jgi:hypothetical protein